MITDATTTTAPMPSPQRDTQNVTPRAQLDDATARVDGDEKPFSLVGDGEFSFWDFLDVINPLQHIPIVNGIYRELTGDTIKPVMKLAGGTLFGGPLGLALSAMDVSVEGATGKDTGQHVAALVEGQEDLRGTAYRLYNEAHQDEAWRDNSEAVAAADAAMARWKAQDSRLAAATSDPIALPTLTITPANAINAAAAAQVAAATPAAAEDLDALPPWDAPATAATPATAVNATATGVTSTGLHGAAGKEFPMPQRRNTAYADDPRPLGEIRATRTGAALPSNPNTEAVPPELSAAAMEAAGLSPEAVQRVLKDHAPKDAANDAKPTSKSPSPRAARPASAAAQTADASEPLWFFDKMNEALEKYRSAQGLSPTPIGATP